jgi:hypothetical protein
MATRDARTSGGAHVPKRAVRPLTKLERMRIAGAIAPIARQAKPRRVHVVDASGAVVATVDASTVSAALRERVGIEFDADVSDPNVCSMCGDTATRRRARSREQKACPRVLRGL